MRSWPRASSPSTGTGESSTTAAVRSGYRRAYSAATFVPYETPSNVSLSTPSATRRFSMSWAVSAVL